MVCTQNLNVEREIAGEKGVSAIPIFTNTFIIIFMNLMYHLYNSIMISDIILLDCAMIISKTSPFRIEQLLL